jgi:hypothetical protein
VFTGVNRNIKIRIAVRRTNPRAVEAKPSRGSRPIIEIRIVLQEIHERFPGVRLPCRVPAIVGSDFKVHIRRAASWSYCRGCGLALSKSWQCDGKENNGWENFHWRSLRNSESN